MQNEETGISLRDMLVYCFLHWRSALVVLLCGIIVGGGFYALKSWGSATSAETVSAKTEATNASYEAMEDALKTQDQNIARSSNYLDNSLLMNIDPTNVALASATIQIRAGEDSPTYALQAIANAYQTRLAGDTTLDELAEQLNTTTAYLRELITTKVADDGSTNALQVNSGASTAVTTDQSDTQGKERLTTISVKVKASDEELAAKIRDAYLSNIESYHDGIASDVVPHTMSVTDLVEYTTSDSDLLNKQTTLATTLATVQTAKSTNAKTLSALTAPTSTAEASSTQQAGISKKAVIKGALLGGAGLFLVYGFILCLLYVMGKSPKTRGQLETRYALPEMGGYTYGDVRFYRHNTGFDRWLRNLAKMDDGPDASEVTEMVAANVRLYADDAKTVLISSSANSKRAQELCDALEQVDAGRNFVLANRLVANPASRERLQGADAVIFVEEYGKSTFDQIDSELTLCSETGKKALGIVMA